MASTGVRSFVKGVSWESISFVITTVAFYIYYHNLLVSMSFAFALGLVKIVLFFIHERFWKKIRWGKYHYVRGVKKYG